MSVSYPSPPITYYQEVAEGNVVGRTAFTKVGFNSVIGTSTQLISEAGSSAPYFPTSAINIEALSASANDTSTGSGVRTIYVTGLNGSFNEISEAITLSGSSPVISTNQFIRVYSAVSIGCGTYRGVNSGDITVRGSSGGTTFLLMTAGQGTALTSHYTVPAGKTLFLHWFFAAIESNKNVALTFWVGGGADVISAPYTPVLAAGRAGGLATVFEQGFSGLTGAISEKTDIWVTGMTSVGSAAVTVEYSCILKSN